MSNQGGQSEGTVELEFNQAMKDFKTMFPDMDPEVIEAVLRANDGAVDASIDELLSMSSESGNEPVRQVRKKPSSQPDIVPHHHHSSSSKKDRSHYWVGGGDPNAVPLRIIKNWNPPLIYPLPSDFLRIRIPRSALNRQHQRQGIQMLASERLAARLAENERKRGATSDPELMQVLEDERMALFLQNEEFMRELRADPEFMAALEKESPGGPPAADGQKSKSMDELEAFRERLRNMGKVSRKKFSQLAKKFHITKRKAGGKYMSHVDVPTRDNRLLTDEPLIADDDDDDDVDLSDINRMRTGNQPSVSSSRHHRGEGGKFEPF